MEKIQPTYLLKFSFSGKTLPVAEVLPTTYPLPIVGDEITLPATCTDDNGTKRNVFTVTSRRFIYSNAPNSCGVILLVIE